MSNERSIGQAPAGEVVLYEAPDGGVCVDVRVAEETVWLSRAQMIDLFERDQSVVSRHLRNVFAEGEVPEEGNMQILHIASADRPSPSTGSTSSSPSAIGSSRIEVPV